MDGQKRRIEILKMLSAANKPLSGVAIGKTFGISRQIVVQDVALLRAEGHDVLATARGYILNKEAGHLAVRMVSVKHTEAQLQDELNTIVDNGGRVKNVIISHGIYGDVVGDLMLKNRRDVKLFVERVQVSGASPLSSLTEGVHIHTIEAATEEELDAIEEELREKGYIYEY
ncbi:MAG: transcription repressor NadR [Cellulosilyticaceae bacterium]